MDGQSTGWEFLKKIGQNPHVLKPLGNYITIRLFEAQKESMGGVVLPDQLVDKDRQCLARVVKAGPGQRALMDGTPMGVHVKEDDLLVILKHTPIEIKLGGATFHVIAEGDIIAVVDEELLATLPADVPVVEEAPAEPVDPMVQTSGGIFVPRESA
jgi:co-chaperonin GroES (HSP10)